MVDLNLAILNDMTIVSVILTTYNSSPTIERLLNSILSQKGNGIDFRLDILVIDDASTDNTLELLKQFDVRVFALEENSGGPNKGRNIGLKNMIGDVFCIVDHDDEWYENKLITQLKFISEVQIVSCGYSRIDSHTGVEQYMGRSAESESLYFKKSETFLTLLQKSKTGQNTYLGGLMIDSSLKGIYFEEAFGMLDFDYVLRIFNDSSSIEITQPLFIRHLHGSNLSLNNAYRMKDYYYSLLIVEDYRDTYPKECKLACRRINGTRARYHYVMGNMKLARIYFCKSSFSLVTILLYLTTVYGSKYVIRKYTIFG